MTQNEKPRLTIGSILAKTSQDIIPPEPSIPMPREIRIPEEKRIYFHHRVPPQYINNKGETVFFDNGIVKFYSYRGNDDYAYIQFSRYPQAAISIKCDADNKIEKITRIAPEDNIEAILNNTEELPLVDELRGWFGLPLTPSKINTQRIKEGPFYEPPKTPNDRFRDFSYNPESFFSFGNPPVRFHEVSCKVYSVGGWFSVHFFLPEGLQEGKEYTRILKEYHGKTDLELIHELADSSSDTEVRKETQAQIINRIKQSLVNTMGDLGMEYLASERDRLGRYENISIIQIHGGGRPWIVSLVPDSGEYLGTTQDLIASFIRQESTSTHERTERIVLSVCNEDHARIAIEEEGVSVNYSARAVVGRMPPIPMEIRKGEKPQRIR